MLRDDNIDKLIEKLITNQIHYEVEVLLVIAKRLKKITDFPEEYLLPLALLLARSQDLKTLETLNDQMIKKQVKEIYNIIEFVGEMTYKDKKNLYKKAGINQIPFSKNTAIQTAVKEVADNCVKQFVATSKPQAFMLRNPANRKQLIPTPLSKAYTQVIDSAVLAVKDPNLNKASLITDVINQLSDSGIKRVWYESESGRVRTQRLDTAVRRNIIDGVRAVSQNVEYAVGAQLNTDGVEITVHEFPAPDHAPIQGHQLSNEEFEKMQNGEPFQDYNGKHFDGFKRAIGTLNCKHFVHVIMLGDKPIHSEKELESILNRNDRGYELPSGKHLTMYECTQYQRRLETEIRYIKERREVAQKAGLTHLYEKCQAEYKEKFNAYATFSKACGLGVQVSRLQI